MQIILLERIEKLGQMGDLVNVKTVMRVTSSSHRARLFGQPKQMLSALKLNAPNVRLTILSVVKMPRPKLAK